MDNKTIITKFAIGDKVVTKSNGICQIDSIEIVVTKNALQVKYGMKEFLFMMFYQEDLRLATEDDLKPKVELVEKVNYYTNGRLVRMYTVRINGIVNTIDEFEFMDIMGER